MNAFSRCLALLVLIGIPNLGQAHGLGITYSIVNRTVVVEARFDSDDPADDCEISITAADGHVIAKGMTDKNGRFSFPLPEPGEYLVVADAGAGHRARKALLVTAMTSDSTENPPKRYLALFWMPIGLISIAAGTIAWMRLAKSRRAIVA